MCDNELLVILAKYWGYEQFRNMQLEACQMVLSRKDVFCLMSTGSGKSLIFQLPTMVLRERGHVVTSLVISPLVSLMEDQVSSLRAMGISAGMLGGSSTNDDESVAIAGKYAILYCTPEKIMNWKNGLEAMLQNCGICCLAVDESHCVSEWGHDFRPSYRCIGDVRAWLPASTPIVALTATATPTVMQDILQSLQLLSATIFKSTFDRPNLKYIVKSRNSSADLISILLEKSDPAGFPSTLVYVSTKQEAESLCDELQHSPGLSHVGIAFYHAGISLLQRSLVQKQFSTDAIQIIICTLSFGMGIHKPDIRLVVNYGIPSSIESYYQQTGRAGRDGLEAECILLYNRQDFSKAFGVAMQGGRVSSEMQSRIEKNIKAMSEYATMTTGCRRSQLLRYFDEQYTPSVSTRCCDLCDQVARVQASTAILPELRDEGWITSGPSATTLDLSFDIRILLQGIIDCGEWSGISLPIDVICGTNSQSSKRVRDCSSKASFGKGKHRSKEWWRALCNQLVETEKLVDTSLALGGVKNHGNGNQGGGYAYQKYFVTPKGRQMLAGSGKYEVVLSTELSKLSSVDLRKLSRSQAKKAHVPSPKTPEELLDDDLDSHLRKIRLDLATSVGVNPYNILSSADLLMMRQRKPLTLEELGALPGWGQWKLNRFGSDFVASIVEFLGARGYQRPKPLESVVVTRFVPIAAPPVATPCVPSTVPIPAQPVQLRIYKPNYEKAIEQDSPDSENSPNMAQQEAQPDFIQFIPKFSQVFTFMRVRYVHVHSS